MTRKFLMVLAIFMLFSMACSLFNRTGNPVVVATQTRSPIKTKIAATATMPVPSVTPEQPTKTSVPTATDEPTSMPTDIPTNTPAAPSTFEDTFDRNLNNWSEDFIVTSQTSGRDLYSKATIQDGNLHFSFMDKETYLYKFFQSGGFANVTIEANYMATGHINNGIALVCKVNEDRTQWYEVRVSSTSDYAFYLYDKARRTELGKNPYLELSKGKFKIDELYPTKPNFVQFTCLEGELILSVNRDKRVIRQDLTTTLTGDGVGLGAMSYDVTPINIYFDSVIIREER